MKKSKYWINGLLTDIYKIKGNWNFLEDIKKSYVGLGYAGCKSKLKYKSDGYYGHKI